MDPHDGKSNPYQPPHTGTSPWFRWSRVPHGLYRGYRGYVEQMQSDGGSPLGHLVCWIGILLFLPLIAMILALILTTVLAPIFSLR